MPDPRFGIVEAFWMPDEASKLGVGWERIIFYWSDLQPRGRTDWTGYFPDSIIESERKAGRQVVGLLIGTPRWAAKPGHENEAPRSVPAGLELPFDDPKNYWARFVERIAGQYKGRIDHWIVWNEPDVWGEADHGATWTGNEADYYLLLKNAYLAAKSANPNATVLFSGLTYWWDAKYEREQYFERVLRVADADPTARDHGYYFDVLPLHLYHVVPYVPYVIENYRTILARHGLMKPIWINELNVVPYDDPLHPIPRIETRSTLEEQTHFLIQAIAVALAAGVERISVYKMTDDQIMKPNLTEPYGLVRRNREVRPAFNAYRTAIRQYHGTRVATGFVNGDVEGVLLDRGEQTTLVLWNLAGRGQTASIEAFAPAATTVEPTGAERTINPVDGWYGVALPGATREFVDDQISAYTIGGKPALLVFDAPATTVRVRSEVGLVTLRPSETGGPAVVEITPSQPVLETADPTAEAPTDTRPIDDTFAAEQPVATEAIAPPPPDVTAGDATVPEEPVSAPDPAAGP